MLKGKTDTLENENLPKVGKSNKATLAARRDMDRREREVFIMRRDGWTFQEIVDYLVTRAEQKLEDTGKEPDHFASISSVKDAYDRYIMRCPERFDLTGRKEQLELAIQRAEDNYKNALERSRNDALEDSERARWSEQAGKWFDRLSKLRALTEDSVIINNFTQNNLVLNDSDLMAKLTASASDSVINVPNFDEYKSADTLPPMIDAPVEAASVDDAEIVLDDEFAEEEPPATIDITQPTGDVSHEQIKPTGIMTNISINI